MQTETIQGYLWKESCRVTKCVCEETWTGVNRAVETGRDPLRKSTGEREREARGEREIESQLSRNLRAYLTAGTRWLGAEEGAAAVALAAGDGTLAEVAKTLECL